MTRGFPSLEEARRDMTPMIDVVFLLIIFFLCIDFKVLEAKLPAYLPKGRGSSPYREVPSEELSVVIHCDAFGTAVPRDPAATGPSPVQLVGHRIHWQVGPKTIATLGELVTELGQLVADGGLWVHGPEGGAAPAAAGGDRTAHGKLQRGRGPDSGRGDGCRLLPGVLHRGPRAVVHPALSRRVAVAASRSSRKDWDQAPRPVPGRWKPHNPHK